MLRQRFYPEETDITNNAHIYGAIKMKTPEQPFLTTLIIEVVIATVISASHYSST